MRKLILGCGSGRCGTYSLQRLLNKQKDASITHEKHQLPWVVDEKSMVHHLLQIMSGDASTVGDVGLYWLNYLPWLTSFVPQVRIICLMRDKEETVASFRQRIPDRNILVLPESKHFEPDTKFEHGRWRMFPKYDLPRKDAFAKYWDDYYETARDWRRSYATLFLLTPMDDLNSEEGQRRMLEFAGIEEPILDVGIKLNSNDRLLFEYRKLDEKTNDHYKFKCAVCDGKADHNLMSLNYPETKFVCEEHIEDGVKQIVEKSDIKGYDIKEGV